MPKCIIRKRKKKKTWVIRTDGKEAHAVALTLLDDSISMNTSSQCNELMKQDLQVSKRLHISIQ